MKNFWIRLIHPKIYKESRWVGTKFNLLGKTYKVVKENSFYGSCDGCDLFGFCTQANTHHKQGFCWSGQRPDNHNVIFVQTK